MTLDRKTLGVAAVVALLACIAGMAAFDLRAEKPAREPSARAGADAFFAQQLPDAAGVPRRMDDYRGKPVVVNFWATWCAPCVQEIPALSKAHADAGGSVAFVGLGIDSPSNIGGFNDRFKPSYPLLVAGAGGTELARVLGDDAGALPFTVVIGPDGRVVASHLGKVDDALLERWLAPYRTRKSESGAS